MNRRQRREVARRLNARGTPVVTLHGGPMSGWVVKADAPVLRRDWSATWPPNIAARQRPGYYRATLSEGTAVWVEVA